MEYFRSYKDKAKHIIEHNLYMSLSTSDKDGRPWVATVLYVFDKKYDFYFVSAIDSLHAKNIIANYNVAFSIYNSNQPIGSMEEVQAIGIAKPVEGNGIYKAMALYAQKLSPAFTIAKISYNWNAINYKYPSEFRFFKISPSKIFTTGGENRRVEVEL